MLTVIERARRYIAKCPPAISGQGGHNATFHVACVLVQGFALGDSDALPLLAEWNIGCQPTWSEADLIHKLKSAAAASHGKPRGYLLDAGTPLPGPLPVAAKVTPPPKAKFRPMVLKRIAANLAAVSDMVNLLRRASPVDVDLAGSVDVLRWLYPPGTGEKALLFSKMESQGQMLWPADGSAGMSDDDLPSGPDGVWLLAQPVDGLFHPNPRLGGKMSRRSEESVTAWRFVVLESDEADPDDWLRCLVQMPLRIVCICESGKRSIHALVWIDAATKSDWDNKVGVMKSVLITLGADPGALSAVRLTRLPQARRGGRVQRLLYLNPAPDGTPIVRLGNAREASA